MTKILKNSLGVVKDVCVTLSNAYTFSVELKDFTDNEILFSFSKNNDIKILPEDNLEVVVYCSNGIFVFETMVIAVEENYPYVCCYTKKPDTFDVKQDREFFRTRFNLEADLTIIFHNGEKKCIKCDTFDVSGSGISLVVTPLLSDRIIANLFERDDFDKYAKIKLTLFFKEREVSSFVEYVHNRALNSNSEMKICAFKFTNLSPTDCDFITKQCFFKQYEEQNKSRI